MDDLEYFYDTGELCILETYQRIQYVKRFISAAPLPNAKLELPKGLLVLFLTLWDTIPHGGRRGGGIIMCKH